jgi:heptosyltransferase-2
MPNHASAPQPFASGPPGSIVVAQLAFIGDMVFTTPLLDALVELWPEAEIAVVGRDAALEVLAADPRVTALLAYDKSGADRGARGLARVAAAVRARRPGLFLGVSRSARTSLLARRSGAGVRVGFAGPGQGLAYHHLVPRGDASRNFPVRPLALLEPLVGPVAPRPLRLVVDDARRRAAAERLSAAGWRGERLLAVAPGAHYATKRWPVERYAALLALAASRGAFRPALYGGPAEAPLLDALRAACPDALDRRTAGIGGLVAELTHATAFVGNDSGPTHIARALGLPAIALHGPTDPDALRDGNPYHAMALGLPCQPCSPSGDPQCPLAHHACLRALSEEVVWTELVRVLSASRA